MIAASAIDARLVDNADNADDDERLEVPLSPEDDPRLATGGNGPNSLRRQRWRRLTSQQRTAVLLSTLPPEVRGAPDLDWEVLPQYLGFYVAFGVAGSRSDRATWALAAAILAANGFDSAAYQAYLKRAAAIVDELRARFALASARDMTWERWLAFGRDAAAMQRLEKSLTTYYSLVNRHMRDYYQHLDPAPRVELERWFLPEMPRRFIDKCVPWEANKRASEQRRKAKTDVLRPLAITLIAIALERRKAAQRFITWFRAQPRTRKPITRKTAKRRRNMPRASTAPQPTPRDPLLERPKRRLVDRIRALEVENTELVRAATRLALTQQEIEAQNMELCAQLVAMQRNLQIVIAEHPVATRDGLEIHVSTTESLR